MWKKHLRFVKLYSSFQSLAGGDRIVFSGDHVHTDVTLVSDFLLSRADYLCISPVWVLLEKSADHHLVCVAASVIRSYLFNLHDDGLTLSDYLMSTECKL